MLQTKHTMRLITYKIKRYYKNSIKNVIASEKNLFGPSTPQQTTFNPVNSKTYSIHSARSHSVIRTKFA